MNQKSEFEQLQALQQKSHSLRQKREQPGDESDEHPGEGTPPEGLISDVGALMTELEEAAAEHPGLALLAAFGIGMVVGQLLSRK